MGSLRSHQSVGQPEIFIVADRIFSPCRLRAARAHIQVYLSLTGQLNPAHRIAYRTSRSEGDGEQAAAARSAMSGKSILLKEEGNRHFQSGDYTGAEGLYSKAYATPACLPTSRGSAHLLVTR